MRGSCSQYWSRSLPEMSILLPAETKPESPIPSLEASSMTATPSAPDCVKKAMFPGGGWLGAKVVLSRMAGSVLITPMQLGPTRRMP